MTRDQLLKLRKPLPYQRKPIGFVAGLDHAGIFMDKRLGKCAVAIRHALWQGAKRILIVAPLSACPGWLDELEADGLRAVFLYGTFGERETIFLSEIERHQHDPEPIFFLLNPEGLFISKGRQRKDCEACGGNGVFGSLGESDPGEICRICKGKGTVPDHKAKPQLSAQALFPWDEVIWDESTNLRNPNSQTSQVANGAFFDVEHRVILSGEFAPEGYMDIFGQMKFLLGGRFMGCSNFYKWRDDNFDQVGYDWLPKKGRLMDIKRELERHCVILSRKAAGVGETKTFERVVVDMPPRLRKAYDHVEKYFEIPDEYISAVSGETEYAVVVKNWLAQIAGGYPKNFKKLESPHKLKALLDICLERYPKEPLVVTFRFNAELFAAAAALREAGAVVETITGATAPAARRDAQKRFQARRLRILLMQAKVARFGIDLSAANTMIRYSLPDPYEDISQPMDRIVHPMKKEPLHYVDLQVRDTIDEDKWMAMQDKRDVARMFMRRTEEFMKARIMKKFGRLPEGLE